MTADVDQGLTFEHYDFNQANKHLAIPEVRQAFALCIDREEIVATLVHAGQPRGHGAEQPHLRPVVRRLRGQQRRPHP